MTGGARMPVVFLPHGGGPWPFVDLGLVDKPGSTRWPATCARWPRCPRPSPRRCSSSPRTGRSAVPDGDDRRAPADALRLLRLPARVVPDHLARAGRPRARRARARAARRRRASRPPRTPTRGFDHGTFVPLKLTYPDADVPAVQLSLKAGLDPGGAPARSAARSRRCATRACFIVGSGMSYHNLRGLRRSARRARSPRPSTPGCARRRRSEPAERDAGSPRWAKAPAARAGPPARGAPAAADGDRRRRGRRPGHRALQRHLSWACGSPRTTSADARAGDRTRTTRRVSGF